MAADQRRLNPFLEDLSRKILWLIVFRAVVALLLLAGTAIVVSQAGRGASAPSARLLFGVGGFALLASAASVLAMGRVRAWVRFTYAQLGIDLLLWTAVVYGTGGPGSYFVYLLDLAVLLGAVYVGVAGAAAVGLAALLLYAALSAGLALGWLPWPPGYEPPSAAEAAAVLSVRTLAPDAVSLLGVALLGSLLAYRTQQVSLGVRAAERAHADLAARSELIVRSLPIGLLTTDLDGRVRAANPEACRLLGRPQDELLRLQLSRLLRLPTPPPGRPSAEHGELRLQRPDRTEAAVDYALVSVRDAEGTIVGQMAILRDVTELVAIRGELNRAERLSTLGKVAAGLAHEIRNPLGAIRSAIDLLRTDDADPDSDRLRSVLLREVDRINALVTQMLTLARPQAPEKTRLGVRGLVDDVLALAREDRQPGSKRIEVDVPEGLEALADAAQIRQVLWNLLRNAFQATPHEGLVRVRAAALEGGVEIRVDDAGPGVPEEERERVFELFYSRRPYGVGIGLATCRQIVGAHGGRILVESSDLGGASFRVWLPG
jgi:PAS domain S-box-containing protein